MPVIGKLIAISASEVLRAQQANMDGDREANVIGDQTLTSASVLHGLGYVTWTFEEGEWRKRKSLLPDQPDNGFTVASAESPEQVEMLRQTWEKGDDEARKMTRMLAELRHEVGRLVVQTTAAVTGKVLTPDDHRRLAEETARQLAS